MKKITALLLVCFVLVNVCFVSANEQASDVSRVLEAIKSRIGSTDEYDEFSSSVSTNNGKAYYRFNWSSSDKENGGYRSMNVGVNSENVIVSYDFYEEAVYERNNKASINRMPSDEAMKIAEEMLKKLNPSVADSFKLSKKSNTESLYSNDYSFKIQRYENSVPVIGNEGIITVSHDASKLLSLYMEYTEGLKSSTDTEFINRSRAEESFYNGFGMKLEYADDYTDGDKKIVLRYKPDVDYGEYISAIDGSVVKRETDEEMYRFASSDSASNLKETMSGGGGSSLSEIEIKETEKISGLISVADAEKLVRKNKIIALNNDFSLVRSALNRDYDDENKYIYNLRFEQTGQDLADKKVAYVEGVNVYLNASDGKIVSFYRNSKYSDEVNITSDEAQKKADEAVKILAPEHFGKEADFIFDEENSSNGNYRYSRYVNGIEYENNSVSVSVNLCDGSIYSYSIDFDDCEFPSADGVITSEEACRKLFEQIDYSVWYLPKTEKDFNTEAVPVYATEANNPVLDAFDGTLMYPVEKDSILPYTDISGHYAETVINTLAKFGVGFADGKFCPDSNIKQADFVALLMSAFTYRHPVVIKDGFDYSYLYSRAKNNGIINEGEYAPESEITRMDAAVMMIRAIGAEEVAKLESIFVPTFADVSTNKGYTSILSAMGVVNGDEYGNFNPEGKLSRADAAMMLYNYLSR